VDVSPCATVGLYFLLKARQHAYGFRFLLAGAMLAVVGRVSFIQCAAACRQSKLP